MGRVVKESMTKTPKLEKGNNTKKSRSQDNGFSGKNHKVPAQGMHGRKYTARKKA